VSWRCSRDLTSNELFYEICPTDVVGRELHGMIGRAISNGSITAMHEITTFQGLPESALECPRVARGGSL
jgi:hypothetical protein